MHVAYGLRGDDSKSDFKFVEDLAKRHDISCVIHTLTPEEEAGRNPSGVQAWARTIRQTEFQRLGLEGWVIALAHHQDDVAETALFRLARGAGIDGLVGMKVWDPPLWRPLLAERKADLIAYLNERGLSYRIDRSNESNDYARNVIRNKVLPELEALFPGAAARIAATAQEGANSAKSDAALVEKALHGVIKDAGSTAKRPAIQKAAHTLMHIAGAQALIAGADGLAVIPVNPAEKAARRSQHRRNSSGIDEALWLSRGSHAVLSHGDRRWFITIAAPPSSGGDDRQEPPIRLGIRTPTGRAALKFHDAETGKPSPRGWRLKDLLRRWNVPDERREEYLAIEYNKNLIGLFDGEALVLPAHDGTKRLLEHPILVITPERPHG